MYLGHQRKLVTGMRAGRVWVPRNVGLGFRGVGLKALSDLRALRCKLQKEARESSQDPTL